MSGRGNGLISSVLSTLEDAFGLQLEVKDKESVEIPLEIRNLAERRWEAKIAKDWGLADQLRGELSDRGWQVKDGKDSFELAKAEQ